MDNQLLTHKQQQPGPPFPPKPKTEAVHYFGLNGKYQGTAPTNPRHIFLYTLKGGEALDNLNVPRPGEGAGQAKFFIRKHDKVAHDPLKTHEDAVDHVCSFLQEMLVRQNMLMVRILQYWQAFLDLPKPDFNTFFRAPPVLTLAPPLKTVWKEYTQNVDIIKKYLETQLGVNRNDFTWPLVDHKRPAPAFEDTNQHVWGAGRDLPFALTIETKPIPERFSGTLGFIMDCELENSGGNANFTSLGFIINFSVVLLKINPTQSEEGESEECESEDSKRRGTRRSLTASSVSSYISATSRSGYVVI